MQPETLTEGSSLHGKTSGELGQETFCNFTATKLAPDGNEKRCLLPAGARHTENQKCLPSQVHNTQGWAAAPLRVWPGLMVMGGPGLSAAWKRLF